MNNALLVKKENLEYNRINCIHHCLCLLNLRSISMEFVLGLPRSKKSRETLFLLWLIGFLK